MPITILDVAIAEGAKTGTDGSINMGEFDRLGLPFFAGCQCCAASLAPYNSYPSRSGFIRCKGCIDEDAGYATVADFQADNLAAPPDADCDPIANQRSDASDFGH